MKLTSREIEAARRLFAGESVAAIAKDLGVTGSAIYAWRKKSEFQKFSTELQEAALDRSKSETRERLGEMPTIRKEALARLREILNNPETSDRVALKAIEISLNLTEADATENLFAGLSMRGLISLEAAANLIDDFTRLKAEFQACAKDKLG